MNLQSQMEFLGFNHTLTYLEDFSSDELMIFSEYIDKHLKVFQQEYGGTDTWLKSKNQREWIDFLFTIVDSMSDDLPKDVAKNLLFFYFSALMKREDSFIINHMEKILGQHTERVLGQHAKRNNSFLGKVRGVFG